jgi:hypothetical protein
VGMAIDPVGVRAINVSTLGFVAVI